MIQFRYEVELVFCIDATGSMDYLLDQVKSHALHFYGDLTQVMEAKHKFIDSLRIRLIAFRDYLADGANAMFDTDFFELPYDAAAFSENVNSIEAFGGGDDPEDGLEALAFAIRSPWSQTPGTKKRQVIVVWSDAPAHPLGYGARDPHYPQEMARSFSELTAWWGDRQYAPYVQHSAKRLILYTPADPSWDQIVQNWDNVIHCPSAAGEGLQEYDYTQILSTIANTI